MARGPRLPSQAKSLLTAAIHGGIEVARRDFEPEQP
jgi:hypothetical protein